MKGSAELLAHALDLRSRRAAIAQDQQENEAACRAEALKSALGEAAAKRRFEHLAGRGVLLAAQAASLDQAIAEAEAEIGQAEVAAEQALKAGEREALRVHLGERLQLAGEIEATLRALLPKVAAYSALGIRIEHGMAALDGHAGIMPALAPEAVGGRLAEFMAGQGYGVWLPLSRPETRPAITALREAEEALQQSYLARCDEVRA